MPFTQFNLPEALIRGVRAAGYQKPTSIQEQAIPVIMQGRDLVGAAQTGTGKTAAFLLPVLARLMEGPRALRALVLVPTRELAMQVEAAARRYARRTDLKTTAVFGGVPIPPQERILRHEGVDLLVATPGRLLDLHGRQSLSLEDVEVLVLDEADRMVDMGFAKDLRRILALVPDKRQTLMFSATMPPELNRVASEALQKPVRVDLSERARPVATVTQHFYSVSQDRKPDVLSRILSETATSKAIVFVRSKRGTDRLVRKLRDAGHDVVALHGDRTQSQRDTAMRHFRSGRVRALIATDIASRGLDIDEVTHVINYDVPMVPEDYVHRIGRTGRMLATGSAVTLVSTGDRERFEAIEKHLGKRVHIEPAPDGGHEHAPRRRRAGDADEAPHRNGHGRGHAAHAAESTERPAHGARNGTAHRSHAATPARTSHGTDRAAHGTHARTGSHAAARETGAAGDAAPSHGRRPKRLSADRRSRRRM